MTLTGRRLAASQLERFAGDGLNVLFNDPLPCSDPSVRAAISGFSIMDEEITRRALDKLAADLESGEWRRRNAALLDLDELDLGYRLVIADRDQS